VNFCNGTGLDFVTNRTRFRQVIDFPGGSDGARTRELRRDWPDKIQ
jgi:hypothetical protein